MSAATLAHSSVALPALEQPYEREGLPALDLPAELSAAYGGPLGFAEELAAKGEKLQELRQRARTSTLTLVYGARDTEHNDAVVLEEILRSP
jgi:hypothetical protein